MVTTKYGKLVSRAVGWLLTVFLLFLGLLLPLGCARRLVRGVLSMLDEECLLPHGTDSGFVALLQSQTQVNDAGTDVGCPCLVPGTCSVWSSSLAAMGPAVETHLQCGRVSNVRVPMTTECAKQRAGVVFKNTQRSSNTSSLNSCYSCGLLVCVSMNLAWNGCQVAHEQHLAANSRLKQFTVHHYNHAVKYDADGFVERNRDKLHTSVAKLLGASTNNMVRRYELNMQTTPDPWIYQHRQFCLLPTSLPGTQFNRRKNGWHVPPARTCSIVYCELHVVVRLNRRCSPCAGCTLMRLATETGPLRVRPPNRHRTTSRRGWRCSSRRKPGLRAGARECGVVSVLSVQAMPTGALDEDHRTPALRLSLKQQEFTQAISPRTLLYDFVDVVSVALRRY